MPRPVVPVRIRGSIIQVRVEQASRDARTDIAARNKRPSSEEEPQAHRLTNPLNHSFSFLLVFQNRHEGEIDASRHPPRTPLKGVIGEPRPAVPGRSRGRISQVRAEQASREARTDSAARNKLAQPRIRPHTVAMQPLTINCFNQILVSGISINLYPISKDRKACADIRSAQAPVF